MKKYTQYYRENPEGYWFKRFASLEELGNDKLVTQLDTEIRALRQ